MAVRLSLARARQRLRRGPGDPRLAGGRLIVVVSGSRDHFLRTGGLDSQARPVLITAPAERLRQRLAGRGRESAIEAAERLERADAYEIDDPRLG